ncbi:hypothetical protein M0R45_026444 [Rubus argutus]|uniref:Protein FAR1-RELATED SEQUENCE n=1 Tax=Rubus argutus TaxID=59490 RepID=A0AAW1X120_RUBAR
MVTMNGLKNNTWVTGMYNKRERWAETFFNDHFFGGICNTQRCEGIHRNLKEEVGRYMRIYKALPRIDKTIDRMRDKVLEDDFRSMNSNPVYGKHIKCLQEQIGKIFTHDIILLIRDHIRFKSKFVVADRVKYENTSFKVFKLTQYGKFERRWSVTYQNNEKNPSYQCSCQLFEFDAIPCCHAFAAIKDVMQTIFPKSLVKKRWTKDATVRKTISIPGKYPDKGTQFVRYSHNQRTCKTHSKDPKIGSAGGPKKHGERGGKQTKIANTFHSNLQSCSQFSRPYHPDATMGEDESNEPSDWEDEEGMLSQNISRSLIHHKEEARTFDIFVNNFEPYHSVASSHGFLVNSSTNNVPLSYTSGDPEPFTTY